MPTVREIVREAQAQNYRLPALVLGVVEQSRVPMRRVRASRSDDTSGERVDDQEIDACF